MFEIVAGVAVILTALALVLEPLLNPRMAIPAPPVDDTDLPDIEESESPKVRALLALREIEFDKATGKLSDEDYATLKARYAAQALEAIKAEDAPATRPASDDPAEAMVRRVKQRKVEGAAACPVCGPRSEPGAVFCSSCGRSLARPGKARCHHCGGELPQGAKFCNACGGKIAA